MNNKLLQKGKLWQKDDTQFLLPFLGYAEKSHVFLHVGFSPFYREQFPFYQDQFIQHNKIKYSDSRISAPNQI
jgi:hypothetical protein